jgi:hypothetical protein
MTKIKVVSDLHLECCEHGHGIPDLGKGEVLILGGDILCARHFKKNGPLNRIYSDFLNKCVQNFDEVLYLAGNHEAYGYNYEGNLGCSQSIFQKVFITLMERLCKNQGLGISWSNSMD